jgi:mevalonate kinase
VDNTTFHSSGKLLLTGEYVVIDGAKALCLPTKKGQSLSVVYNDSHVLKWRGLSPDGVEWLHVTIDLKSWEIISSSSNEQAEYLVFVLKTALDLNPKSRQLLISGADVTTQLEFPTHWGLGSSSTFLCNVAKWLEVDAFKLHFAVSNGSGYDIAVGMNNCALLYNIQNNTPIVQAVQFNPPFADQLYFVHLNQKQISSKEVEGYTTRKSAIPLKEISNVISNLTNDILKCRTIAKFEELINIHEELLSHVLGRKTIKNQLFSDYTAGTIKSLGAWGGDFILISTTNTSDLEYFETKGYNTIISYAEMIS